MLIETLKKYYTPEEYLALEETAQEKSEYRDGEIIPITGATANHNQITLNLAIQLRLALKGKPDRVFMNDLRLWIPHYRCYTYPDVMLIGGTPVFTNEKKTSVTNPLMIAEVLSDSTMNYDKADKFDKYRSRI